MPLPWLIGAAVVAAAAAVTAAVNSDSNSSSNNEKEEERVRQAAESKRKTDEQKKKKEVEQQSFSMQGNILGKNIQESLAGWVNIEFKSNLVFKADLETVDSVYSEFNKNKTIEEDFYKIEDSLEFKNNEILANLAKN